MSRSTYEFLLDDLRCNDMKGFRAILQSEGLPQDDNWYDYDLLMRALRSNRKRMVNILLDKRCRVSKPRRLSVDRNTPLHLAAAKASGWCDVIDRMLRLGARVTDANADGNTPLHLAFLNHLSDAVVRKLLDHYLNESAEDIPNNNGLGFMHIACMSAKLESVQKFFDLGMSDIWSQVRVDSQSIYAGYSCLHFAVAAGKHEVVEFLCQYEADVYAQDRKRSTPLHFALERKDSRMIEILCYYDHKNLDYVNDVGVSHFMAACAGADPHVVEQYLLIAEQDPTSSARALLNTRVKDIPYYPNAGYTPLHFACEYGRVETVVGLLDVGALHHCSTPTTQNLLPLDLARRNKHEEVVALLQRTFELRNDPVLDHAKKRVDVIVEEKLVKAEMKRFSFSSLVKENESTVAVRSGRCAVPADKAEAVESIKGNTVFGLSRDRIYFFAKTFVVANFPRFLQNLASRLINFIMGPKPKKPDCEFCMRFNPRQPEIV